MICVIDPLGRSISAVESLVRPMIAHTLWQLQSELSLLPEAPLLGRHCTTTLVVVCRTFACLFGTALAVANSEGRGHRLRKKVWLYVHDILFSAGSFGLIALT